MKRLAALFRWTLIVLMLVLRKTALSLPEAGEESAAEQARRATYVLEKADEARDAGKFTEALLLYRDAISRYTKLAEKHPEWEKDVVRLRLVYCEEQLSALLEKKKPEQPPGSQAPPRPSPSDLRPLPKQASHSRASTGLSQIVASVKPLVLAGKYAEARAVLIEGLQADPDDLTLRYLIGVVQCQGGNHLDAAYVLETLVEEHPEHAAAHVALGVAYLGLDKASEAEREFKTALELNPHLTEALYNLARVVLLKTPAEVETARQYYRTALEYGASPDADLETALGLFPPEGNSEVKPSSPTPAPPVKNSGEPEEKTLVDNEPQPEQKQAE